MVFEYHSVKQKKSNMSYNGAFLHPVFACVIVFDLAFYLFR